MFSECHLRWSLSGQNDPDAFLEFLHIRAGRSMGVEAKKALILFRTLRCGERGEDTDLLNFTTKAAPDDVAVELGYGLRKLTPNRPMSSKQKSSLSDGANSSEDALIGIMSQVADTVTAKSSGHIEDISCKRSRLGEQRKMEGEGLVLLLSHKKTLRDSGLAFEDPEILEELDIEIKSCKNRLRHFRREEDLIE